MPGSLPSSPLWKTWRRTLSSLPNSGRPLIIQAETGHETSALELDDQAARIARQLRPAAATWIAFSLKNQADWVALFLACQAVGAAALPLDSQLPHDALSAHARSLGAHYLWQDGSLVLILKPSRTSTKVACLKTTSGSMGQIRTIRCSAEHLIADGKNIIATMKIRPRDKNLGLIPLGHSYGLGNLLMPLLLQGTSLVCAREFVPAQIPAWIAKYKPTLFPTVPGILRVLAQLPGPKSLRPLRTVISAGAPLSAETARAFFQKFNLKVHNFYGSSETGGIAYDPSGSASLAGRSVGMALAGVTLSLSPTGRICVSGKAVAMPKNRHVLSDRGEWNRQGELTLLGRVQTVANIGGRKVAPAEIEQALGGIAEVSEARAWVIHLQNRDYLAAAVESSLPKTKLLEKLHRQLPAWKIPRFLHAAPTLPRNARGKLDSAALRAFFPA